MKRFIIIENQMNNEIKTEKENEHENEKMNININRYFKTNEPSLIDIKSESSTLTNITSNNKERIKKYKSAYIIFCTEIRNKLKSEYYKNFKLEELDKYLNIFFDENKLKKYNNNELTLKIADFWNKCPLNEKEYFFAKEKEEKEIFEEKKQKLNIDYKYPKCVKFKKPIRFRTAYMYYLKEHKEKLQSKDRLKNIEYIRTISNKWNEMTIEEKDKFNKLAIDDKIRYENEYKEYIKDIFTVSTKQNRFSSKNKEKINKIMKKFLNDSIEKNISLNEILFKKENPKNYNDNNKIKKLSNYKYKEKNKIFLIKKNKKNYDDYSSLKKNNNKYEFNEIKSNPFKRILENYNNNINKKNFNYGKENNFTYSKEENFKDERNLYYKQEEYNINKINNFEDSSNFNIKKEINNINKDLNNSNNYYFKFQIIKSEEESLSKYEKYITNKDNYNNFNDNISKKKENRENKEKFNKCKDNLNYFLRNYSCVKTNIDIKADNEIEIDINLHDSELSLNIEDDFNVNDSSY
jgi:hypothetical protein